MVKRLTVLLISLFSFGCASTYYISIESDSANKHLYESPDALKAIVDKLKVEMIERDITQSEVYERLGVSSDTPNIEPLTPGQIDAIFYTRVGVAGLDRDRELEYQRRLTGIKYPYSSTIDKARFTKHPGVRIRKAGFDHVVVVVFRDNSLFYVERLGPDNIQLFRGRTIWEVIIKDIEEELIPNR